MEQKENIFSRLSNNITIAKSKITSVSHVSDMCILKIRDVLKQVDFKTVVKYVDEYKARQIKKSNGLSGEELTKANKKIKNIDEIIKFIGALENFSKGGEFVNPSQNVLEIAKDMAEEKDAKVVVMVLQAIQLVGKFAKPESNVAALPMEKEDVSDEIDSNDEYDKLITMISIAVSDDIVTDDELALLKQQASLASVAEEELQQLIEEAKIE